MNDDRAALDNIYRERNAVVAALIRTNGWPASIMAAPDAEGWWIVYAETPLGQVSWHIAPDDVRLFDDFPRSGADWDGHDTDTKYERVARLARSEGPRLDAAWARALAALPERLDERSLSVWWDNRKPAGWWAACTHRFDPLRPIPLIVKGYPTKEAALDGLAAALAAQENPARG